jgi:uncharacterized protein (DUF924 family)
MSTPAEIVGFWRNAGESKWFQKDDSFDAELRRRFEAPHLEAARGQLKHWGETSEGALALLLLLDQIPRNIYRGSAHAFATDVLAQHISEAAIDAGHDRRADPDLRAFFYLPFEHAEDIALQARGVALFEALGNDGFTRYAYLHRDIIARFGRFPHRNAALGRTSTPAETEFLATGGFKG